MILGFWCLFFFFGYPFLMWSALAMMLLAVLLRLALRWDAGKIGAEAGIHGSVREGGSFPVILKIRRSGRPLVAGSVRLRATLTHTMSGVEERRELLLPMAQKVSCFELPVEADECGELQIRCESVEAMDFLRLFRVKGEPFREMRLLIYPRRMNLRAELSQDAVGAPKSEGRLQNRKGSDPSEIFDIREYQPGDDIRSIHWKLSSKTVDSLIVRESSDPSHYNVVLLADCCAPGEGEQVTRGELNMAAALTAALGEQLLQQGASFCMAFPTDSGLHLREVTGMREFQNSLTQWMSVSLQKKSGMGLQYFGLEHMEQYFTKLVVISAGKYSQELGALDGKIGITVISTVEGGQMVHARLSGTSDMVELPVSDSPGEVYRILC